MDKKSTEENKKKEKKILYTTAGIRKKSYKIVKDINKATGIKKIDILSDLLDEMPTEFLIEFIEKREKTTRKSFIKGLKNLDASLEKIIQTKKKLRQSESKIVGDAVNKILKKKKITRD